MTLILFEYKKDKMYQNKNNTKITPVKNRGGVVLQKKNTAKADGEPTFQFVENRSKAVAQNEQPIQKKENKSGLSSNPIQMYSYTHGGLYKDSGKKMKTDKIASGDTGGGSKVSAWPNKC